MKKLVVVMLMVMMVSAFAMAESNGKGQKGDIEVGGDAQKNIYGVYNITDRITTGMFLGYQKNMYETALDPWKFGIFTGYDIIQWKGNHVMLGLGLNHNTFTSYYNTKMNNWYEINSFSLGIPIRYSFNFKFGLVLAVNVMPQLVFNAYNLASTEKIPVQYKTGFNIFIGWKF